MYYIARNFIYQIDYDLSRPQPIAIPGQDVTERQKEYYIRNKLLAYYYV